MNNSNKFFSGRLDFFRRTSGYYIESRYPLGPPVMFPKPEIETSLNEAEEVIKEILKMSGVETN